MKIVFKTASFFLIQLMLLTNICWAQQDELCLNHVRTTLSPALQITNQVLQGFFIKKEVIQPATWVKTSLIDRKFERNKYIAKLEIQFHHDQPGILHSILLKIGPNAVLTWLAMFKKSGINVIKFGIETNDPAQINGAIERLKEIEDKIAKPSETIKTELSVLDLALLYQERDLMIITTFLKKEHINVSRFLTPSLFEKGYSHFVFELKVPEGEDERIRSELERITEGIGGYITLKKGQLIDRILDGYLLKDLHITKDKKIRNRLRRALKVIVRRRMSMSRKDLKTPFVMHPVEVVRILVNEIKLLTPSTIAYLSKALGLTERKLITDVLSATLLHDSVEDGDIHKKDLRSIFGERISDIVLMLSKEEIHKTKKGEAEYLKNMVSRTDIIGLLVQIIKIADRLHNIRNLADNDPEFQRKIFFSTLDVFIPELINKIDLKAIKNKKLRNVFKNALELFDKQVFETGLALGFLDTGGNEIRKSRQLYEVEEKIRHNNIKLKAAEEQIEKTMYRRPLIREEDKKLIKEKKIVAKFKPLYPLRSSIESISLLIQQAI